MLATASTTSGQRGGLLGRNGMANFENLGSLRALETLPPTQMERPSFSGSFICMAAQTVKQLEQYIHCSSITFTVRLPSTTAGRMAPVGQEAMRVGISQPLRRASWRIWGGLRWMPRMAMSEQCTADRKSVVSG